MPLPILLSSTLALTLGQSSLTAWWEQAPPESRRLRAANAALEKGDAAAALEALNEADELPLAHLLRGRALRLQKDEAAARRAFEAASGSGSCLPPSEDPLRYSGLRELAEPAEAGLASEALARTGTPEDLFRAAELHPRGSKDRGNLLRRLVREHPGEPQAKEALKRLGLAGATHGLSAGEQTSLALAWLDANDNPSALEMARGVARDEAEPADRCKLDYIEGKALRKLRKYRPSLEPLASARKACATLPPEHPARNVALRAGLLEAQVLGILGRTRPIEALYAELKQLAPEHTYLDDVLNYAAEASKGRSAMKRFRAVAELNGDQSPRARWKLASHALERRDLSDARKELEALLGSKHASADDRARAEFYLARIESTTASTAAARRLETLSTRLGFYGFAALAELKDLDPERARAAEARLKRLAKTPSSVPASTPVVRRPELLRARIYHHAGFSDWAVAELRRASCGDLEPERRVALATLLSAAGELPAAQRLVRWSHPSLLETFDEASLPAWRLAFPLAFEAEVEKAARVEKLDPLLLTALAREESTFDPRIVSWAGATGLTQLMPPTAEGAYRAVAHSTLDPTDLLQPELNLRLGAHVLGENVQTFGSIPALGLSAYNGGPGLTRRVLPTKETDFVRWAESNPVKENRRYVKRVLGTWFTYRLLHHPEHALPSWPATIGPGARVRAENVDIHSQD